MPLGMEAGLGPGYFVLDGDPWGPRPRPWPRCVRWGQRTQPQFSAHICCDQMAGWIKMPLAMEVDLGPDHIVRWGPSSTSQGAQPPIFGSCLL